jgi:DNA replication protein DnaD
MMNIDELFDLWGKDSQIDRTEIDVESSNIPQLHHKYYKLFSAERLRLRKLEQDYKSLFKDKWDYYQGNMAEEDLKEKGWNPNPMRILKQDLDKYIDSDPDIIKHNLRISVQKEKVDFLDSVLRMISNRSFQLKGVIDWERFKVGI